MKTYTVKFQICGKKLKKTFNEEEIKNIYNLIISTVRIDNIRENDVVNDDPTVEHLKNIFGMS